MSKGYAFEKTDVSNFGRIAVLMGGRSAEREVSLKSGTAVLEALLNTGADAFAIDAYGAGGNCNIVAQLQEKPFNTAVNMLHGGEGENGVISAVLETLNIPYTGSNMAASSLALDKVYCKFIWQGMGLPTAEFELLGEHSDWQAVVNRLGLPLFVKPVREGSSIGMTRVDAPEQLEPAYQEAARYDARVMAECWINGPEFTVGILRGQGLPAIRLETERLFYDYQAKYIDDDTRYLIPCGLSEEEELRMQQIAVRAFDSLGCKGWGRVDLMQDEQGSFRLLEVNTVPGMTDHSLVPMAAKAAGLNFEELVLQILATAKRVG